MGNQWMPKAEADDLRKRSNAKIEQAMEYLRLSNGELARKTWKMPANSIRTASGPIF